jgi:hypothetical protein
MAARIQFVVKRRMNASKVEEVGQMRRRKGTSMKRMMKEEALPQLAILVCLSSLDGGDLQT